MRRLITVTLLLLGGTATAWSAGAAAPKTGKSKAQAAATANVSDSAITEGVEARLAKTRSLKTVPIHVETKDGVVTLTGTVQKWWQKGVATREAKRVAGVKKVSDQLKIAPGGMPHRKKAAKKKS
jgi:hyperosmotically inducible protein